MWLYYTGRDMERQKRQTGKKKDAERKKCNVRAAHFIREEEL